MLASDTGLTVILTLTSLRGDYPENTLIFAKGGDRSNAGEVPESAACATLNIDVRVGVGGAEKSDSSSRINAELGVDVPREP